MGIAISSDRWISLKRMKWTYVSGIAGLTLAIGAGLTFVPRDQSTPPTPSPVAHGIDLGQLHPPRTHTYYLVDSEEKASEMTAMVRASTPRGVAPDRFFLVAKTPADVLAVIEAIDAPQETTVRILDIRTQ
jgi:hypothetical protein